MKVEKPHEPHLAAFMEAYLGAAANNAEFHYQCCNRLLIILFSIKTFAIGTRPSRFTKYQLLHISEFILKTTEEIPISHNMDFSDKDIEKFNQHSVWSHACLKGFACCSGFVSLKKDFKSSNIFLI